ncbi:hypothetical protein TRVA0_048S00716 [Trichomonascus vanleenenianus]|uniref:uncharacterized protein n=1 Tax=Trichomonascus vanleenenianus TaxID=2268995 RepID=UPI003EC9DDD2
MVSKLSVISLALAVAGALGQCTLSSIGQTIVNDIDLLINHSNNITQQFTAWDGQYLSFLDIDTNVADVINDMTTLSQDLSSEGANDCDFQTVISKLDDAAPAFANALQAIENRITDYNSDGMENDLITKLSTLIQDTLPMVGAVYVYLPCEYVGQTFDAMNSVLYSLALCQHIFSLNSPVAPAKPQTCSRSTPTPTSSPNTCSKKQAAGVKRAN